ncbi:GNAT family N-acetyltransferase [Emcibacter sp. SYSU 3D8]|uniref:GNAT family N-acetyltransferase n=1 Tax=Emcibacter sp. SYSU 3D8 TaxID=3133969 RepID=UPI0031FE88F9
MQPIIETLRLVLSPAVPGDAGRLGTLLAWPQVRRFLCDDRVLSPDEVSDLLAEALAAGAGGLGFWLLTTKPGSFVGLASLMPVYESAAAAFPDFAGDVEPTIALEPAAWSHGYAGEALAALIAHAGTLGHTRLAALVDAPNMRSHRMVERAGFARIGTARGPRHTLVAYVAATRRAR